MKIYFAKFTKLRVLNDVLTKNNEIMLIKQLFETYIDILFIHYINNVKSSSKQK